MLIVFKIILLAISSWLVMHILAILGIFLVFAYPIWWLFAPQKTPCIACRFKKNFHCRAPHIICNMVFLLVCTMVGAGLVFLESQVLIRLGFLAARKTVSFAVTHPHNTHKIGEIFPIKIELTGIEVPINAVQADIQFEPSKFEVVDISTLDSFANIFIQKEINNEVGFARITGGLPNPGYAAGRGIFASIYFRAKNSPGVTEIIFLPSSMALANDGKGSNVLRDMPAISHLILPEKVTHEQQQLQQEYWRSDVLGKKVTGMQMNFFEEGAVLGTKETEKEAEQKSEDLFRRALWTLQAVDLLILEAYTKVFGK